MSGEARPLVLYSAPGVLILRSPHARLGDLLDEILTEDYRDDTYRLPWADPYDGPTRKVSIEEAVNFGLGWVAWDARIAEQAAARIEAARQARGKLAAIVAESAELLRSGPTGWHAWRANAALVVPFKLAADDLPTHDEKLAWYQRNRARLETLRAAVSVLEIFEQEQEQAKRLAQDRLAGSRHHSATCWFTDTCAFLRNRGMKPRAIADLLERLQPAHPGLVWPSTLDLYKAVKNRAPAAEGA